MEHPVRPSTARPDDAAPQLRTTTSRGIKKHLLDKWNTANTAPPQATTRRADAFNASGVRKPRRYPKLLTIDANGVPVSVRASMRDREASLCRAARRSRRGENVAQSFSPIELLHMELERVQRSASTRFHIKMNLRGRSKLSTWLANASTPQRAAAAIAVPKLELDARLLSQDRAVVRTVLTSMRNLPLRVLEALAHRLSAKDALTNWAFVVRNAASMQEPQLVEHAYAPDLTAAISAAEARQS